SKLRENAKQVIGVGVKQSTSDLLVANCDEFIFYDDLVRERQRQAARRQPQQQQPKRSAEESSRKKEEQEARKAEAIEMVVETFDALTSERGDSGKIWASLLKDTLKRRRPDFNETYFGFRTFGNLLEEAQARGLLEFGRDEKSGAYVYRPSGAHAVEVPHVQQVAEAEQVVVQQELEQAEAPAAKGKGESRRRTRGGRKSREEHVEHAEAQEPVIAVMPEPVVEEAPAVTPAEEPAAEASAEESPRRRPARKTPARKAKAAAKAAAEPVEAAPVEVAPEPEPAVEPAEEPAEAAPKRARKPAARPRRPAKPKA
ncbi:MAG TPA: OST-HTH/LOTUS domain-containing protein, partial [Telluria sp.]